MIHNIRHKGLDDLYQNDETRGVKQDHVKRLRRGFYAVTVSGNWRVIFRFEDGAALDVDYIDYH